MEGVTQRQVLGNRQTTCRKPKALTPVQPSLLIRKAPEGALDLRLKLSDSSAQGCPR